MTLDGREPVVSIGMPVRNGAVSLSAALESIVGQTFADLEIVISDNDSTDETAAICQGFAARDPRIHYIRQPRLISATDNFAFVRDQARGRYFMWAAHDDTRDLNFIERAMIALETNPRAILTMGDVVEIRDGQRELRDFVFDTTRLGRPARLHDAALKQCYHIYGLWRLDALKRIALRHGAWWPDTSIMMAGACIGDYVHVPGTAFYYQANARPFWARGGASVRASLLQVGLRRLVDLGEMTWMVVVAVTEVAGPFWGFVSGIFALEKIARQIIGYFVRRTARLWA